MKYNYHPRKVVWDQISLMVRAGFTAHVACGRILEIYGVNTTVTQLINMMRIDRRRGGHPALRIA